jgi:glycosyltransferase involved in cell wall biosynthesis
MCLLKNNKNKHMKLIFVAHDCQFTGATKSLLSLVEGLHIKQHEIVVFLPEHGPLEQYLDKIKIKYHITGHRSNTSPSDLLDWSFIKRLRLLKFSCQRLIINRRQAKRVSHVAKTINADAIITNTSTTYFGFLLSQAIGVKHIWHLREFGELDHGFKHDFNKRFQSYLQQSIINICISKSIEDHYKNRYNLNNTTVVYNGVAIDTKFLKSNLSADNKTQVTAFIFVGQLTKAKGIWKFVKAVEALSHKKACRAYILGEGKEFDALLSYLEKKNLKSTIALLGYINHPGEYFEKADCFIMASDYEAFGRTTVEAIIHNCFVIANSMGATKELLKANEEALFFDATTEDLLHKMVSFINMNGSEVKQIKLNALNKVTSKFTTAIMVDNFENSLSSVIK